MWETSRENGNVKPCAQCDHRGGWVWKSDSSAHAACQSFTVAGSPDSQVAVCDRWFRDRVRPAVSVLAQVDDAALVLAIP